MADDRPLLSHPLSERNELRTVVFFKPEPKPAKAGGAKAPRVARAEIVFDIDKSGGDAKFVEGMGNDCDPTFRLKDM